LDLKNFREAGKRLAEQTKPKEIKREVHPDRGEVEAVQDAETKALIEKHKGNEKEALKEWVGLPDYSHYADKKKGVEK